MKRLKEASNGGTFDQWPVIGGRKNESCGGIVQYPDFFDLIAIAHTDADVSLWHMCRGDCFEFLGRISSVSMMSDASEVGCRAERKVNFSAVHHHVNLCSLYKSFTIDDGFFSIAVA